MDSMGYIKWVANTTMLVDFGAGVRCSIAMLYDQITIPDTNVAPENGWLEDCFPFGMAYFRALYVRECTSKCHFLGVWRLLVRVVPCHFCQERFRERPP